MRKSTTLNLGTGAFVLLGFAALFFLTTQTTSRGINFFTNPPHYELIAKFDNVGDLKVGAPVSMSGVEMGRVTKIGFDSKEYKAVVTMRIDSRFNQIPTDSDAAIYTQGLLGGKFIGLTAGGAETYLKDKDQIDFTQSAFVLENLIGQVLANFVKSSGQSDSGKSKPDAPATPEPKHSEKTK
jgi:phospholipid/cholesterol/gamma-HCH transport system substrate-binding protein